LPPAGGDPTFRNLSLRERRVGHSSAIPAGKLRHMKRKVKTLAGLQRVYNATNNRLSRLYTQQYVLQPALARYVARFDELDRLDDPAARFQAFRLIPSLEYDLEAIHASLGPEKRKSLAQQGRAKHRRVRITKDGATLETIIHSLLGTTSNPWKLKAKQYWPRLISQLDQLGLNPTIVPDPADPARENIDYYCNKERRTLSFGQFQNIVSKLRRKSRTLN
jgi:hypothetical protein